MASNVKLPIARVNPAQGFTQVPLFTAGGKWFDVLNFRMYQGVSFTFNRKKIYSNLSATSQTLTIPTPTCQIQT